VVVLPGRCRAVGRLFQCCSASVLTTFFQQYRTQVLEWLAFGESFQYLRLYGYDLGDLAISGLLPLQVDVADNRLCSFGNLDSFDANDLRTAVAKAAHRLDLGGKRL
jgi:hypothetical protein